MSDRVADAIARFSGSMTFVYLHVAWFTGWIVLNLVLRRPFDPFPFGLLTLIVSLEAIFLSTFVLIVQNRQAQESDFKARQDFVTNVQAEVWSELIGKKLGIDPAEVRKETGRRIRTADRKAEADGAG